MKGKKPVANLMIDASLIGRICDYADLKRTDRVLEIGAGTGNLSAELAKRAGHVYAIEKDARLFNILRERMVAFSNVEPVCGDALKVALPAFDVVVSNMPYEISRKAVELLVRSSYRRAVLVFQKEYAEKLVAEPGRENYRFISALAQSSTSIELLEEIPPAAFSPMPPVLSAVVRMRQRRILEDGYVDFLHRVFDHRNKRIGGLFRGKDAGPYKDRRGFELSADGLFSAYELLR